MNKYYSTNGEMEVAEMGRSQIGEMKIMLDRLDRIGGKQ